MTLKVTDNTLSLPERHARILDALHSEGAVTVAALAAELRVSEVTIRKDLSALEEQKKLYRAHGGAIPMSPYVGDRHVSEKEKQLPAEKRAIGTRGAAMIAHDDTIIIASGTTMLFLTREIVPQGHLTVITASLPVTSILSQNENTEVIQLGGVVRHSALSAVGHFAEDMLSNFSCSKLYLGADGIDADFGITTTNAMEANLNRVMMRAAQKTIILADSSKFGRRGFSKICSCEEVDTIITDSGIQPRYLDELRERGIEVLVVDPRG